MARRDLPAHDATIDEYSYKGRKPVFLASYWYRGFEAEGRREGELTCCLDYSIAKEGELVAA